MHELEASILEMDGRLGLLFGGLFLFLISFSFPDENDQARILVDKIQDLHKEMDLCKDDQCRTSIENLIDTTRTSLNIAELPGKIKVIFFIGGILSEVLFGISLRN